MIFFRNHPNTEKLILIVHFTILYFPLLNPNTEKEKTHFPFHFSTLSPEKKRHSFYITFSHHPNTRKDITFFKPHFPTTSKHWETY